MTLCETLQAAYTAFTASGFHCSDGGGGRLLIVLQTHTFPDGDLPEVLVDPIGSDFVLSDFGAVLSRLEDAGLNPEARATKASIDTVLKGYEVSSVHGELQVRTSQQDGPAALVRLVDAMLQLDGFRAQAPSPRGPVFARQLTDWLTSTFSVVDPAPRIMGGSGREYRLTASVQDQRPGPVFLQAVGASSDSRSVDHTFRVFSDVNGQLMPWQKVAVLNEREGLEETDVRLLAGVSFVAGWWQKDSLDSFLRGREDVDRILFSDLSLF